MIRTIFMFGVFAFPLFAFASGIEIYPQKPMQGEPLLITVDASSTPKELLFGGKKLSTFSWKGKPAALYGIDLYKKPGTYKIKADFADGSKLEKSITIIARKKVELPFGIPEKLGGNTATSAAKLVDTLAQENASFLGLRTGAYAFWGSAFKYPVEEPFVTDSYGYQRKTGQYSIAHKGTDFRAKEGTKVMAMNWGVVRLAREGRNYGKTIILDHGLGLQTFYMHLSKMYVRVGELVRPGQVIGLSGQTGYAEMPHLHVTVRINEVSIDPEKFMDIFK